MSATVDIVANIWADDADDVRYRWKGSLALSEPVAVLRKKWAEAHGIIEDAVGFDVAFGAEDIDMQRTPEELGWNPSFEVTLRAWPKDLAFAEDLPTPTQPSDQRPTSSTQPSDQRPTTNAGSSDDNITNADRVDGIFKKPAKRANQFGFSVADFPFDFINAANASSSGNNASSSSSGNVTSSPTQAAAATSHRSLVPSLSPTQSSTTATMTATTTAIDESDALPRS